jgi:pilus assembly protein CpaB
VKIQRPNIKINKTWLMLIAAIVLALLTTWLTTRYLTQREQSIEAEVQARSQQNRGATVAVVVPIRPLPSGTMLTESLVAARNVPADFVYDDTITVAEFQAHQNQVLLRDVNRGKPLRKTDVQEVFADFSGSLKPGTRAITIQVDEINSVSHMVQPGNLVDLMLMLSGGDDGSKDQSVVPFLEKIKVLATGQKVTHDDPSEQDPRRRVSYSTLTLEVTPTQAARLTLALELGKIRAVLRNEKDKDAVYFDSINAGNLLHDSSSGLPGQSKYVEYYIGGKNNDGGVSPAINVPVAPGLMPSLQTGDASATPAAAPAIPQNLTDLVKLSLGNSAQLAQPSK